MNIINVKDWAEMIVATLKDAGIDAYISKSTSLFSYFIVNETHYVVMHILAHDKYCTHVYSTKEGAYGRHIDAEMWTRAGAIDICDPAFDPSEYFAGLIDKFK